MNSMLGVAISSSPASETRASLLFLQQLAFDLGADLATVLKPGQTPRITAGTIEWVEKEMDALMEKLPPLKCFILPGGSPAAAHIHVARTIARRAERETLSIPPADSVTREPLIFLNRLSDYLFLLARRENQLSGVIEQEWHPSV
jgi:cob(I)alamin adenosyltransferase